MHKLCQPEIEKDTFDSENIANLFSTVYPEKSDLFTANYFRWRYEDAFSENPISVVIHDGSKRIGQATIFQQRIISDDKFFLVAQLGDLAVHPDFRSPKIVRSIYQKLRQVIDNEGYKFIFTTPNSRSHKLNKHYLKLKESHRLHYYFGFSLPRLRKIKGLHHTQISQKPSEKIQLNISCQLHSFKGIGVNWAANKLIEKCLDPSYIHYVHSHEDVTIITRVTKYFGVRFFVIKSILSRDNKPAPKKRFIKSVIRSIAHFHRTPFFVYWGINSRLGDYSDFLPLTMKTSKSILIQYSSDQFDIEKFSRFELIDLDIT